MILVTGDVVLDHNIYVGRRLSPVSGELPATLVKDEAGGARLIFGILEKLLGPDRVKCGIEDRKDWPPSFRTSGLWDLDDKVWRLTRNLGYGPDRLENDTYPGKPIKGLHNIKADLIVIDDAGLGFRHQTSCGCWPKQLEKSNGLKWVVLKMSRPLARGDFWGSESIRKQNDRLVVIVSADDLRSEAARISRGLSWESTVDDLVSEAYSGRVKGLLDCRHLIVTLHGDAVLWFDRTRKDHCRLIFDRNSGESGNSSGVNKAYGYLSAMTASVANGLHEEGEEGLTASIHAGLSACREVSRLGHGTVNNPGFPFAEIAATIGKRNTSFSDALIATDREQAAHHWSILEQSFRIDDPDPLPLFGAAHRVALFGPDALSDVPCARFGAFRSMDRREIEGLRHVRKLMETYRENKKPKRPLSIAVFGPPGAGKSFALKQIAIELFGEKNPILEFNLSQYERPEDLLGAFHQIRDAALAGKTPLAFWDEFDADDHKWLSSFLAPMQDGKFQQLQLTHSIGKCIFVFAGGVSHEFAKFGRPEGGSEDTTDFIGKKGPDFRSRLAGHLNVLGPNPQDRNDVDYPVRRALLMRGMLDLKPDAYANMDRGLLTALLCARRYLNGARSIENLLNILRDGGPWPLRSNTPPNDQLKMFVAEEDEFERLMGPTAEFQAQAEKLAPVIHGHYLDNKNKAPQFDQEWQKLGPDGKQTNIAAALRLAEVLAMAGLRLEPGKSTPDETKQAKQAIRLHLEFMAQMEHDGWCEQKRAEGWIYGKTRDNARRVHNLLIPYSELADSEKNKDRSAVGDYPELADLAGFKIVPMTAPPDPQQAASRSLAATT